MSGRGDTPPSTTRVREPDGVVTHTSRPGYHESGLRRPVCRNRGSVFGVQEQVKEKDLPNEKRPWSWGTILIIYDSPLRLRPKTSFSFLSGDGRTKIRDPMEIGTVLIKRFIKTTCIPVSKAKCRM